MKQVIDRVVDSILDSGLVEVEVSARHVHLTQEDVEKLFGKGAVLHEKRALSQKGQYLSEERVTIIGPKGRMERVAVLEGIVDSTNMGAIFRSAAALGMDAVLLTPTCCDPLCRRAVRVSMGTIFQVPWARIGDSPADWPETGMELLRRNGFATAAMALDDRAISIDDPRLRQEEKLAVLLGTEGDGLSHQTIARCDYTVMIPMEHGVDSLNVAAASAVAFWQLRLR